MLKNRVPRWSPCLVILILCAAGALSGCTWLPGLSLGRGEHVPKPPTDESEQVPGPPKDESPGDPKPGPVLPQREVVIYYCGPEGAIPGSEQVLRQHHDKISYITGFWYQIDRHDPARVVPMSNSPEHEIQGVTDLAHSHGVKVEALFHNLLYGSSATSQEVATRLLADQRLSARLAEELVALATHMQFDGINIDVEFVPPRLRHQFTAFVEIIATALQRENIRVSLSIPAKTSDDPSNGWSGGYDYAALGAIVDRLMLMTYDEHGWASDTGGPIASAGWAERVVEYAVREVPPHKILLGIPAYGFRWTEGNKKPVYLDYAAAMGPIWRGEAVLGWDARGQVPMYQYGGSNGTMHKVWFEDAASSSWKLDTMQRYQLRGFALWRAGMEDPDLWRVVAQKMRAEREEAPGTTTSLDADTH